jgi:hypothetical protein
MADEYEDILNSKDRNSPEPGGPEDFSQHGGHEEYFEQHSEDGEYEDSNEQPPAHPNSDPDSNNVGAPKARTQRRRSIDHSYRPRREIVQGGKPPQADQNSGNDEEPVPTPEADHIIPQPNEIGGRANNSPEPGGYSPGYDEEPVLAPKADHIIPRTPNEARGQGSSSPEQGGYSSEDIGGPENYSPKPYKIDSNEELAHLYKKGSRYSIEELIFRSIGIDVSEEIGDFNLATTGMSRQEAAAAFEELRERQQDKCKTNRQENILEVS